MNLGFDLDEVIGQTAQMAMDHMNEKFQCSFTTDILESFYFDENVYSEDPDEQKAAVETLLNAVFDVEMMATVKPFPNAAKVLQKLKHQGHKIFIITKRHAEHADMTARWLRKHNIPYDKLVVTHLQDKGVFAKRFQLDFFLDDLEENLYEMYYAQARWRKGLFLMTRPWNDGKYIDTSKITRLNNWSEVFKAISIGNRLKG